MKKPIGTLVLTLLTLLTVLQPCFGVVLYRDEDIAAKFVGKVTHSRTVETEDDRSRVQCHSIVVKVESCCRGKFKPGQLVSVQYRDVDWKGRPPCTGAVFGPTVEPGDNVEISFLKDGRPIPAGGVKKV